MFRFRKPQVLNEVGAAIGNLEEALRGKPDMGEIMDEALHRHLETTEMLRLPKRGEIRKPGREFIETTWREVEE